MTGFGNFAQKWQQRYKKWLWKTINEDDNLKKVIIFQWVMFTARASTDVREVA